MNIDRLITIDALDCGVAILVLLVLVFAFGYAVGYESRDNKL
jgi:hypothetical protein